MLAAVVLLGGAFTVYRKVLQGRTLAQTRIRVEGGIDSLEPVVLGGVAQWLLIRGEDSSRPVLLFVHGGPGSADMLFARRFDGDLVREFVVVHWDQRGAGKSYRTSIPQSEMTREHYISDLKELAENLLQRFGSRSIYLVGHSWGSEIGLIAASRYPDLFTAYIGVGQVVRKSEQERISYEYTLAMARQAGDRTAEEELLAIEPPPYSGVSEQNVERKWLEHYGGVYHGPAISFNDFVRIALTSPEYTLLDGWRFLRGRDFSEETMYAERLGTDLERDIRRVDIPVYFFAGRFDYNTPSELVERYFRELEAPAGKRLVWFEEAGHMIPYEAPTEFMRELVRVRDETLGRE